MAGDVGANAVINYIANVSDIKRSVKQIQSANKILASELSKDFTKSFNIINSEVKKIQFGKKFKIQVDDKKFKTVIGTVRTVERTIQTADGQLLKFQETIGTTSKGSVTLATSLNKVAQAQSKLTGQSSKLKTNFDSLRSINASFGKELGNLGNATKFLGTSLNQVSDSGSKTSKIFETTNGKFVQLTETTKKLPSGVQQVSRSVKELSKAQIQNIRTLEGTNKQTRSLGANLKSLLIRASLTIPVWFALRRGVGAFFRTIKDGIKDIVAFDGALQKLRRNVEATSTDVNKDLSRIQQTVTSFSLKSGKSVESITNAIQKFATVGFDIETSLQGGLNATKLAITLFGDVEGTAQAFARTLRVLTEDMGSVEEKQLAIKEALALTDQLWQTNAFEVDELSNNLLKFAGTAKVANLSINETLALLATLSTGGLANTAGRLLKTTILKSLQNIEKVSKGLRLDFDPKTQPTIEFILALVSKLKELKDPKNVPVELAETLGQFFSLRSARVVASLIALEKTLKENIALTPDIKKFNGTFERLLDTTPLLAEQFTNLNREIGKAFVNGIVGADNFDDALKTVVNTQSILQANMEKYGQITRDAFLVSGVASVIAFRSQLAKTVAFLASNPIVLGAVAGFTVLNFKAEAERLAKQAKQVNQVFTNIGEDIGREINKGFRNQLSLEELETLIARLEVFGASQLGFDEGTFATTLTQLQKIRSEVEKITNEQTKQIEQTEKSTIRNRKRREISELILQNELEILKARGARNAELIKTEQILRKHFDIQKTAVDQLKDQISLQRELNEEKELNNSLSTRTKKLTEIGRTEGIDVATAIGDVLRGDIDFNLFERIGGKNLEVFKKEFNDIFKEQQDIKFLQNKGFNIPISISDERTIKGDTGRVRKQASLERRRAESFVTRLQKLDNATIANTNAETLNTQSLQQLNTILNQGGILSGNNAQTFVNNEVGKQSTINNRNPLKQILDININIDGRDLNFSGTPEAIRALAGNVSAQVAKAVEDKLVNDLNTNNNAPISKATDGRIDNF